MSWIGKHIIFDGCFHPQSALSTVEGGSRFLVDLVQAIGMTIMSAPQVIEYPVDSDMFTRILERISGDEAARTGIRPDPVRLDKVRNGTMTGISGLVVLSESHAAYHTFPEVVLEQGLPFVSLDIYSCKDFSTEVCTAWLREHGIVRGHLLEITRYTGQAQQTERQLVLE